MCSMRAWLRTIFVLVIFGVILGGCSEEQAEQKPETGPLNTLLTREPEFTSVLPGKAQELLQSDDSIVVIDVRTPAEREHVRIADSIAVPLGDILGGRVELPRDKPLMLVCAVGGRSYAAGLYLMNKDYRLVYNLRGGIAAWEKAGLPLEFKKQ